MPSSLVRLRCGVQHYGWGDTEFIPSLLGIDNAERQPYAELWMGAHPDLPAGAEVGGRTVPLDALIRSAPAEVLGPTVAETFEGHLPYLFKVLSAGAPLSIQTHPSKAAARAGFAREDAAGIPRSAPHRNYRDENHKPELITALTDFYGLRGFRPLDEIAGVLRDVTELSPVMPDFAPTPACLRALYERFMALPQDAVDRILDPLVARLRDADRRQTFTRDQREYWVLRADRDYSKDGHRDRGLFSIYLLNLVRLAPGEAMFLPAGVLHAYLEGSGMEIMANSNNVLRGGLTPKHVDVPELIANITFEGASAEIIHPAEVASGEWVYRTPAREFELRRLEIVRDRPHACPAATSAEILILVTADTSAGVTVSSGDEAVSLERGDVLMAPHGVAYAISANAPATLYKAVVP